MRLSPPIQFLLAAGLALILVTPLAAQSPDTRATEKNLPKESARKQEKAKLEEVTRVSTEKAAQSAAKEKTKARAEEKKEKGAELSGGSQVTEFHPAAAEESAPAEEPGATKTSKKSRVKHIHGSIYGAGGSQGSGAAGGAVGATTKSGKTSVYVESEKSRTASPTPH